MAKKKTDEQEVQAETPAEETSIVENVIDTVASAAGTVADVVTTGAAAIADAVTGVADDASRKKFGKRAEKIGVVASDKMTKTVVVRVDRLVKHPIYRKYVRKRKKF